MRFPYALLFLTVCASAQVYPPVYEPQGTGAGLPVPAWLRGTQTITGHIVGIDTGKITVNRLDENGAVTFSVDEKTKVHVEKNPLRLADLQEGDPVAVKMREIKGKGPYALEIMPHPDVLRRKQNGGSRDGPPMATPLPVSQVEAESEKAAEKTAANAKPPSMAVPTARQTAAASAAASPLGAPELPAGVAGLQGTIKSINNDEAQLETLNGEKRKVLVTAVTRIVRAGVKDELMDEVRAGDRVAVMGDSVDNGLYIAREILVNRPKDAQAMTPPSITGEPALGPIKQPELKGDFTGTVDSVANEIVKVRVEGGRIRPVITTPITKVRKWNNDASVAAIRVGDEVKVSGDVLEDGGTLAHEITVTKAGAPAPR